MNREVPLEHLYRRGGVWWWRKMVKGVLHRKSTGQTDLEMARRRARELEKAVRGNVAGWVEMPTYGAWVAVWLKGGAKLKKGAEWRDPNMLAPTVAAWGDRRLDTIRKSDCEALLVSRQAVIGRAVGTIWLECIRSKMLFNRAVDDELIKRNPWKGILLPKPTKRSRVLVGDEEARLRAKLTPAWDRLTTVVLGTGMRRKEVLGITPAHVEVGSRLRISPDLAKSGIERVIELRPDVRVALEVQGAGLNAGDRYWPYTKEATSRVIRRAYAQAGILRITLHDLRRTFGTRCAEAGMHMPHLQKIMGHESLSVTMDYYVHLSLAETGDALLKVVWPTGVRTKVAPGGEESAKTGANHALDPLLREGDPKR